MNDLDLARSESGTFGESMPALPIKMLKQTIPAAMRSDLSDILRLEATYQAMCYMGGDLKEGIASMIEKRPPRFTDEY